MSDAHLIDAEDAMEIIVYSWPGSSRIRVVLEQGGDRELEIAGVSYSRPPDDEARVAYDRGHVFVRCNGRYFIYQRLETVNGTPQRTGPPELRRASYPDAFEQYAVLPPMGHETVSRIEAIEFLSYTDRIEEIQARTLLSPREAEVFVWREYGADRKQVAELLGIAPSTVDEYSRRIKQKVTTAFHTVDHLDAEIWECSACGETSIDPRTVVSDGRRAYVDCPNCGELDRNPSPGPLTAGATDDD